MSRPMRGPDSDVELPRVLLELFYGAARWTIPEMLVLSRVGYAGDEPFSLGRGMVKRVTDSRINSLSAPPPKTRKIEKIPVWSRTCNCTNKKGDRKPSLR